MLQPQDKLVRQISTSDCLFGTVLLQRGTIVKTIVLSLFTPFRPHIQSNASPSLGILGCFRSRSAKTPDGKRLKS